MENTHRTFAKKTLAVVVTGFLATGLGLTTTQAAHANIGTTQTSKEPAQTNTGATQTKKGKAHAGTFQCPKGLSLVENKTIYKTIDQGPRKSAKVRVTYTCSNSDSSIVTEYSVDY